MGARSLITIAALMGAVAVAVVGFSAVDRAPSSPDLAVAPGASGTASPTPDVDPTASATPTEDSEPSAAPEQQAIAALTRYLALSDQVLQRGDGDASEVRAVATGFALGEIEAAAQERHDLELRQVGGVRLADVEVVGSDLSASPPTVTLSACLDASALDYLDAAGQSQKDRLYNPDRPVEHVYGVTLTDSGWLVSTHSIPDTSRCA